MDTAYVPARMCPCDVVVNRGLLKNHCRFAKAVHTANGMTVLDVPQALRVKPARESP